MRMQHEGEEMYLELIGDTESSVCGGQEGWDPEGPSDGRFLELGALGRAR